MTANSDAVDYSKTLFLPETPFPMRAGLPQKEPELLARWEKNDLYGQLRRKAKGRPRFVLHDGPPYANGNIHIGHALNKILKDLVTKSQQMLGADSNYVPGWDCHGLPIEWKIEEEYRAKGRNKDEVPVVEFRRQCREFATHWLNVQREEFKRLGVIGDWDHPYSTMAFHAEAQIAREIMKFARTGQLYRGSKPVMWSVVEKTALAEAEVEYHDHQSDMVWVAFPVKALPSDLSGFNVAGDFQDSGDGYVSAEFQTPTFKNVTSASVVIWTTTPWTLPGNRAVAYSPKVPYGLYEVTANERDFGPKVGEKYILAKKMAEDVAKSAKITLEFREGVPFGLLEGMTCAHPFAGTIPGYDFAVPLLDGDHVTDEAGTGFVHTAPSHGREDFDVWMANGKLLAQRGIDTHIPYTVDADGAYTKEAPGFEGKLVLDADGNKPKPDVSANEAVIKALIAAGRLVARGRLKHQYPHSWRSKKPVIFRNTPQWFIAMDRRIAALGDRSLRDTALAAIKATEWVPAAGENRITGMIENRPDWVVSRQRAWGVPITVFVNRETGEMLADPRVDAAIAEAFEQQGGDAWFTDTDGARFLSPFGYDPKAYEKVGDVLDVWFDSGSTHSYVLNTPAHFPGLADVHRKVDGGVDQVMYLEGSDQHRGWFHSSLLESCGTRGRAPFDIVLTHGFCLDEKGQKMSKSMGNVTAPQEVMDKSGADILRLWVAAADYSDDLRIGPAIMANFVETYRKMRNSLRWMLGSLAHFKASDRVAFADMPELERLMLHRLAVLDGEVREAYAAFDYKRVVSALAQFMNTELSAFYFDIRKDALYCDPASSLTRRAALTVIDTLFDTLAKWLAPILSFTAEEAWLARHGDGDPGTSVHLELFPDIPAGWRDETLAAKWEKVKAVRRVVTGALEIERAAKRIGSSLEAAPRVSIADPALIAALNGIDMADIAITSALDLVEGPGAEGDFRLADVPGVAVGVRKAGGRKCARSWKYFDPATADPAFPDVTPRDARALKERRAAGQG